MSRLHLKVDSEQIIYRHKIKIKQLLSGFRFENEQDANEIMSRHDTVSLLGTRMHNHVFYTVCATLRTDSRDTFSIFHTYLFLYMY